MFFLFAISIMSLCNNFFIIWFIFESNKSSFLKFFEYSAILTSFPFKFNAEKLYKRENIYDIILVLDFNMNPIRKNKGSAIFIHVAKKNYKNTEGCIALKKTHLLKIIKNLNRNTVVTIGNQK